MAMADSTSLPFWWIAVFLLLALGLGVAGLYAVGGTLISSSGVLLPLPL